MAAILSRPRCVKQWRPAFKGMLSLEWHWVREFNSFTMLIQIPEGLSGVLMGVVGLSLVVWAWCNKRCFTKRKYWGFGGDEVANTGLRDKTGLLDHYRDVIMNAMAFHITSASILVCSDQRKHLSSTSLAFVRGIHRSPVDSPNKGPVTRKKFPFDDVIMRCRENTCGHSGCPTGPISEPSCIFRTLKNESCHDANFVVTADAVGCHNDNQWRLNWRHGNFR